MDGTMSVDQQLEGQDLAESEHRDENAASPRQQTNNAQ
jgi:hypothetical protein